MSLPLYVEPSPQISTPCSAIACTSIVPVTARPSGVVLKYVRPAVRMWNAPHCSAARPCRASASRQSTSTASSAPYCLAFAGTAPMSGSSYWPRSAVNAYGIAPFSRIHASAQHVSSPPENAMPTRSPIGSELRMTSLTRSRAPAPPGRRLGDPCMRPAERGFRRCLRRAYGTCSGVSLERVPELLLELGARHAVARGHEDRVLARDRAGNLLQAGVVDRVGE